MQLKLKYTYDDTLPAFRCTSDMSTRLRSIAEELNAPISAVQRAAVEFFLESYVTDSINDDTEERAS